MTNIIHYGFGTDYLKDWGIQQALREVYQNFLDYGSYSEKIKPKKNGNVLVEISNTWEPASLDFLRIGNSQKKDGAIGKHGEGLKMAFLIFQRLGLKSRIFTSKHIVYPSVINEPAIGECFVLKYEEHGIKHAGIKFIISFEIEKQTLEEFKSSIITAEDVEFSNSEYGDIVNREKGNIYSGGLFVAKVNNLSRSYNINPRHLQLDRDRSVPRSFDVNWSASRILESYEKWSFKDETYDDTQFISRIPDQLKQECRPIIVGSSVEFVIKDETGADRIIKNGSIKETLKKDNIFQAAIKKLKNFIAKKLGLYDLLLEFKAKHIHDYEAIVDFDLILERVKGEPTHG